MLRDSRVRKLSFTGSTEVGRTLLATASEAVVSSSMELDGNAPFLVFDEAELEAAVSGGSRQRSQPHSRKEWLV